MTPAPNRFHQEISRNIEFALLKYLENNPIGKIYHAPFDVYLTDVNVFQPDILFVAKDNYAILTDEGAQGAPDLAVEILSPKTAHQDKEIKRAIYARTGVRELWIVDPDRRSVEVYRLRQDARSPFATYCGDDRISTLLLPDFSLAIADVFAS